MHLFAAWYWCESGWIDFRWCYHKFIYGKKLQCNLMPNSLQTWFPHSYKWQTIYFSWSMSYDKAYSQLVWRYKINYWWIKPTYQMAIYFRFTWSTKTRNLHLGNKLRSAHIQYKNQKMKVCFATQLFSKSVAQAL